MGRSKVTVYEMAKLAGVSTATVSRSFNPDTKHQVASETLKKLEILASRLHYTPSRAARFLGRSKYKTIGVLFPHQKGMLASEYYSTILNGVAHALLDSDYRLEMVLLKPRENGWDAHDFQHGEGLDGLIVTYWRTFFENHTVFRKLNIPCVAINNVEKKIHVHFLAGEHYAGGRLAAEYLYMKGHRNIIVVGGKNGAPDAQERLEGFLEYLKEKEIYLLDEDVVDVGFEQKKAYDVTHEILRKYPKLTAIFCMNDIQAHGVLKRLEELGVPCPEKISVMGYDDDFISSYSKPPLTTIRVPVYEMAKKAAQDLLHYLKYHNRDFYSVERFGVKLIERESVRVI